jgi:hypothetical protein
MDDIPTDSSRNRRRAKLGRLPYAELPPCDCSRPFPCSLSIIDPSSPIFTIQDSRVIICDSYDDITLKTVFSFQRILSDAILEFSVSVIYVVVGSWLHPRIAAEMERHRSALFPSATFHTDPFTASPSFVVNSTGIKSCDLPIIIRFETGLSIVLIPDDATFVYSVLRESHSELARLIRLHSERVQVLARISLSGPRFDVEQMLKTLCTSCECVVEKTGLEREVEELEVAVGTFPDFTALDSVVSDHLEFAKAEGRQLDEQIESSEKILAKLKEQCETLRSECDDKGSSPQQLELDEERVRLRLVVGRSTQYCQVLRNAAKEHERLADSQKEARRGKEALARQILQSEHDWQLDLEGLGPIANRREKEE